MLPKEHLSTSHFYTIIFKKEFLSQKFTQVYQSFSGEVLVLIMKSEHARAAAPKIVVVRVRP
jgi:hypothetical protein